MTASAVGRREEFVVKIRNNGGGFFLLAVLICSYAGANLRMFVGTLAVFGSILVLVCGYGDTRYAAKKFAAWHFIALILFLWADVLAKEGNHRIGVSIFHAVAFGILTAAYPFNGWTDSFFMRAPAYLSSVWLVAARPLIVAFFLAMAQPFAHGESSRIIHAISTVLILASLAFVPLLLFAKMELRRIVACVACWQSGYLWLFARYLPRGNFDTITMLAIVQGILIGVILQVVEILNGQSGHDSLTNVKGLFDRNYFLSAVLVSSWLFLIIAPPVLIFKKNILHLPAIFFYQMLGGMILPGLFSRKIYKLMAEQSRGSGDVPIG
jgi:hypothetical protein